MFEVESKFDHIQNTIAEKPKLEIVKTNFQRYPLPLQYAIAHSNNHELWNIEPDQTEDFKKALIYTGDRLLDIAEFYDINGTDILSRNSFQSIDNQEDILNTDPEVTKDIFNDLITNPNYISDSLINNGYGRKSIYIIAALPLAVELLKDLPPEISENFMDLLIGMMNLNVIGSLDQYRNLVSNYPAFKKIFELTFGSIANLEQENIKYPFDDPIVKEEYKNLSKTDGFQRLSKTLVYSSNMAREALLESFEKGYLDSRTLACIKRFNDLFLESEAIVTVFKGSELGGKLSEAAILKNIPSRFHKNIPKWAIDDFKPFLTDMNSSMIGSFVLYFEALYTSQSGGIERRLLKHIEAAYGEWHSVIHILLNDCVGIDEDYYEDNINGSLIWRLNALSKDKPGIVQERLDEVWNQNFLNLNNLKKKYYSAGVYKGFERWDIHKKVLKRLNSLYLTQFLKKGYNTKQEDVYLVAQQVMNFLGQKINELE